LISKGLEKEKLELLYKRCPKCHGRLFLEADIYGQYESCLCGFHRDIEIENEVPKEDWSKDSE